MRVLANKMETLYELKQVHTFENLPGALSVFPCMIIMPVSGDTDYSAGGPCVDLTDVQLTVFTSSQVLPEAYARAIPFIKRVKEKLAANVTLDGTVSHCMPGSPFYTGPGQLTYGGLENKFIGIIFRVRVKEIDNVTVTA